MKSYRKINKREQEKRLEWVKLSNAYRKSMKKTSWKNEENGMSPKVHNGNTSKRMKEKRKKNEKKLDNDVGFWYNISREWREIANPVPLERHVSETEEVNASPPQVSIERSDMVFAERSQRLDHWLGEVRFLSRLPN